MTQTCLCLREECKQLQSRMAQLLEAFDPESVRSIFSTKGDQVRVLYFVLIACLCLRETCSLILHLSLYFLLGCLVIDSCCFRQPLQAESPMWSGWDFISTLAEFPGAHTLSGILCSASLNCHWNATSCTQSTITNEYFLKSSSDINFFLEVRLFMFASAAVCMHATEIMCLHVLPRGMFVFAVVFMPACSAV